jgi:hypothetical protein
MFEKKLPTRVIIHVLGDIKHQIVKHHELLLLNDHFVVEIGGGHCGSWGRELLRASVQENLVGDLAKEEESEKNDDVYDAQRGGLSSVSLVVFIYSCQDTHLRENEQKSSTSLYRINNIDI